MKKMCKKTIFFSLILAYSAQARDTILFEENCMQQEEPPEQAMPSEKSHATEAITTKAAQEIEYVLNSDLSFKPLNDSYYQTIIHELDELVRNTSDKQKSIELSGNIQAQQQAPTIYKLLNEKMSTLAQRMKLDPEKITICIQPTPADNKGLFNAHAQQIKGISILTETQISRDVQGHILSKKTSIKDYSITNSSRFSINEESLRLLAWMEGDQDYATNEGLLDGVGAHELGHIVHQHTDCTVQNEHEADATGKLNLNNPDNLINSIDVLYFSGNLFECLKINQNRLNFSDGMLFLSVQAIVQALTKHLNGIGALGLCTSHAQFANEIYKAVTKAMERINRRHVTDDLTKISLLYDEIKYCTQGPLPSSGTKEEKIYEAIDHTYSLYSPLTHPDPKTRRQYLASVTADAQSPLA